ncbi:hypothetical protein V1503_10675 [Bacillus sp. SCS-151]
MARVVVRYCSTIVCRYETATISRKWEKTVYEDGRVEQACTCS